MNTPILQDPLPDYCLIEECEDKPIGRGWCSKHYQAWLKYEDPLGKAQFLHHSVAEKQKHYRQKIRQQVLTAYGNKCNCCSSTQALQVDHVNGNGRQHRKELGGSSTQVYRHITKTNFPPEFQLLCKVCNYAKDTHTSCPIILSEADNGKVLQHQKFSLVTL